LVNPSVEAEIISKLLHFSGKPALGSVRTWLSDALYEETGRLGHFTAHLPADRHLPRVDGQGQFDFLPAPLASPVADSFNLRRVHDRQLTPPSHIISRSVKGTRSDDCSRRRV
jgi:hypothetical protein